MKTQEWVLLVHGTGATAPSDEGVAWWQRSGPLWTELASRGFSPEGFIWSGENSERARRLAGLKLARRIQEIATVGGQVHLIGHSHGGSVIAHALVRLTTSDRASVLSWTSVGTPFLRYGLRLPRLIFDSLVLLGACGVLIWAITTLQDVDIGLAWDHDPKLTAVWFVLLAVPLVATLWPSINLLPFLLQLRWRGSLRRLAAKRQTHLALWSRQDEPIIGLRASGSFSLRLLSGAGVRGIASLLKPLSNATNQFVNNLVSRALQGSNIPHLAMLEAANAPTPDLAHKPLPREIDDELIERANQSAAILGLRVREVLASGRDPVTGFSDLQRSAAAAFSFNELVHTTYFQSQHCINLILHHVLSFSTVGPRPPLREDIHAWYGTRFDTTPTPPTNQLPSNRMGYAVAGGLAVITLILALSVVSLGTLHTRVLAPTTAGFYLTNLINSERLAVALSSIISAERLEQAGGLEFGPDSTLHLALYSPYPEQETDLSNLKPYLQAIVHGGQLDRLVESVSRLEAPELRRLFYKHALPLMLEVAERDQVLLLAKSLLPGPSVVQSTMRPQPDFYYPTVDAFLESMAARDQLDQELFEHVVGTCPPGTRCATRARLVAARALLSKGNAGRLHFLLPLPSAVETVQLVDQQTQVPFTVREYLLPFYGFNKHDGSFVVWLASQQAWDHIGAGALSGVGNMHWNEVNAAVRKGLERVEDESINYLLHFIVSAKWEDEVPNDVVKQAQILLEKQVIATDRFAPRVTEAQFKQFVRRERSKLLCASLEDVEADAFDDRLQELKTQGARCYEEQRKHNRQRRAIETLERARDASSLFGSDGFLRIFAKLRTEDLSTDWNDVLRNELFTTFWRAVCPALDEQYSFDTNMFDREELVAALHTVGKPRVNDSEVASWMNRITSNAPCAQWAQAEELERNESMTLARSITFEVINWLDSTQPEEALKHMQWLSGTIGGPRKEAILTTPGTKDYAVWFQERSSPVDLLFVTSAEATSFRLMRRAALFRLASCEQAQNFPTRASQLALLAERSGYQVRQHAAPEQAMQTIRAEAEYYALLGDWRRAVSTCGRCNAWDMVKVASDLIIPLGRRQLKGPVSKPLVCEEISDTLYEEIVTSTQAIEKQVIEDAQRRAAYASQKAMQKLENRN
jgi:hypothetical protein